SFVSRKEGIGESRIVLTVRMPKAADGHDWGSGYVTYGYELPQSFTSYIKSQGHAADKLTNYGFLLPQLVFFVLAVVYAATFRKFTSFRRGIFLASLFFLFYAGLTIDMAPALRAGVIKTNLSEVSSTVLVITNIFILAGLAILTYF